MMDPRKPTAALPATRFHGALIVGGSPLADRIREFPWECTPLGRIDGWPSTLLTCVNLILNSPLGLAIYWGPEMVFLGNDATFRMLGPSRWDALGMTAPDLWGDHWHQLRGRFEAVLTGEEQFEGAGTPFFFPRQGLSDEIFVNYSLSPIYHEGQVAGILRSVHETTDASAAMRALAEANEHLRMVRSAGSNFGFWDCDIRTGVVTGDETIARFFGLDPTTAAAGIPRQLYEERFRAEDIQALNDAALHGILTGQEYTVDYRLLRDDGSSFAVRTHGRCVYDEQGHASSLTGVTCEREGERAAETRSELPSGLFQGEPWDRLPVPVRSFVAATLLFTVDHPEAITLQVIAGADSTEIVIGAAADDLGKLIGKQGRTVRAIRTLLLAVNKTSAHRYSIDIRDGRRLGA